MDGSFSQNNQIQRLEALETTNNRPKQEKPSQKSVFYSSRDGGKNSL